MFVVGIIAYRKNWLNTLNVKTGYTSLFIAILLALGVYVGILNVLYDQFEPWKVWAIYESLLAVTMIFGLLTLFREIGNKPTPLLQTLSRSSFAAYIFHMPIVLAIQYALDTVVIGGAVGKFIVVSVISVVITYALCALLVRVRLFRKIL